MSCDPVLICRGVTKRYGKHTVLDRVDLDVNEGEVVGLLGPNGAGKTTLIRMILGLGLPASGRITVFGLDLFRRRREILRRIGAVVEAPAFFEALSGIENLRRLVTLTAPVPESRLLETLEWVGLGDAARRPVRTYSFGMKQRLGIAQALLPSTRFLVLDEPTNGLDPRGIAGVRRLVRTLAHRDGLTILISSHLLAEIEQVCDRVAVIHRGRCILQAPVDEIRTRSARLEVDAAGPAERLAQWARDTGAAEVRPRPAGQTATLVYRPPPDTAAVVRELAAAGADILRVQVHHESLEEMFLRLTRTGERDRDVRIDAF